MKTLIKTCLLTAICAISACSTVSPRTMANNKINSNFPILKGMPVAKNHTPYSPALACLAEESANSTQYLNQYRHTITVGQIKDLTGKYDQVNGGYVLTQGASDMMLSALFKTDAYRVVERNSMEITEFERSLASQKLVREFDINDVQRVRGVTMGEVFGSDYRIVGSITEMNYNIASGGYDFGIAGVGTKTRAFVADVGLDLFLVDTKTTQIISTVSVKKQLVGYETRSGVFRFFNEKLFDLSLGDKKQEPMQLAVRSALELAVFEFTEKLYGKPAKKCQDLKLSADGVK